MLSQPTVRVRCRYLELSHQGKESNLHLQVQSLTSCRWTAPWWVAGEEGIEPSCWVLETLVLPEAPPFGEAAELACLAGCVQELPGRYPGGGGRDRTCGLEVMGLPSYHCSTPLRFRETWAKARAPPEGLPPPAPLPPLRGCGRSVLGA